MRRRILLLAVFTVYLCAQGRTPNVEFELMTWQEVKKAIHEDGMINVVVYNGGVEQRGPQAVNGGHNLMGRETARAIALKMGHTFVTPVMPYSVDQASADLPGTIAISASTFAAVNREVAESLLTSGFKNVFLMGEHGGGQKELGEVAKELDAKYSGKGVHVYYCDEIYEKAQDDYEKWLADNKYPSGGHAATRDTSELLYLGGNKGWVRKDLIRTALGDPVLSPGQKRDPAVPLINNGITGDARPSTPELGKRIFDMRVDYAVSQMRRFIAAQKTH